MLYVVYPNCYIHVQLFCVVAHITLLEEIFVCNEPRVFYTKSGSDIVLIFFQISEYVWNSVFVMFHFRCKIVKTTARFAMSVHPSIHPQGPTAVTLDGFS